MVSLVGCVVDGARTAVAERRGYTVKIRIVAVWKELAFHGSSIVIRVTNMSTNISKGRSTPMAHYCQSLITHHFGDAALSNSPNCESRPYFFCQGVYIRPRTLGVSPARRNQPRTSFKLSAS